MINPNIDWSIYEIYCRVTDIRYIGSAYDYLDRWNTHKQELNAGKHLNLALQKDWTKYGRKEFEFQKLKTLKHKIRTKLYWFELRYIYEIFVERQLYNVPRQVEFQCYTICRQLIDHKIKFEYKEYLDGRLLDFMIYPDDPWTDDFFVVDVHDVFNPNEESRNRDLKTVKGRKAFCEERGIPFILINPNKYFLLSDIIKD
ncbi:MAG: GIY-YIG nuclease family protein [Chloroflexi bacterium]|nr:GIY-YIG nuclease family protein [Chloroflexota bacterium]